MLATVHIKAADAPMYRGVVLVPLYLLHRNQLYIGSISA